MTQYKIDVKVDPSGVDRGSRQVEQRLNRVSAAADRTRNALRAAFAFVTLGTGLVGGISLLADFEQQMSTVKAITGATEGQFKALRAEAQRLGSTTRFSASQAAEGMTFLARAGFDTSQTLASIEGTLLLAQAGALDLGRAADIASNVLTGFGLQAAETGRVVDVLALAANSANTDVSQLGEAMKFVAPVAAGMGVSLEEATAAVSKLSDAGLQGSLAGTGLRRILSELESPASKTQKILAALGLTASDVRVSQVGLTVAMQRLAAAGVDTGLALELFGDRGGPAFAVLSQALGPMEAMTQELANADGTAKRIADTMDDNLNGALLSVRSAFEGLILALGESGATGLLTSAFRALADGIRFLTENIDTVLRAAQVFAIFMAGRFVFSIFSAHGAIGALIKQHVALELALGASSRASAIFSAATKGVTRSVIAMTAAIAANPIGFLIVAVTTIIGLLYTFHDQIAVSADGFVKLQDVALATFEFIRDIIAPVGEFLEDAFITALAAVGFEFDGLIDVATAVGTRIINFFRTVANGYVGFWVGAFKSVTRAWDLFPGALRDVGRLAINGLISIVEAGIKGILGAIDGLLGAIDAAANAVGLDDVFGDVLNPNAFNLNEYRLQLEGAGREVAGIIKEEFGQAFNTDFVGDAINSIMARAREIAEAREARSSVDAANPVPPGLGEAPGGTEFGPNARPNLLGIDSETKRTFEDILRDLEREAELLQLSSEERDIRRQLLEFERELNRELTEQETAKADAQLRTNEILARKVELMQELEGPEQELLERLETLNLLYEEGNLSLEQYNQQLIETQLQLAELRIQAGEGSFADGFLTQLGRMTQGVSNFRAQAGQIFGQFFTSFADGFANSVGRAIVFSENLGDALKNVARNAIADLIGAFIKLGLQFIATQVLSATLGSTATALGATQAGLLASAWAPAAALASLATLGANAAPAAAAVTTTMGLTEGLALAGAVFADGGLVAGPGGPRSDNLLAAVSPGEFIMNASATRGNKGLLAAMNAGSSQAPGIAAQAFSGSSGARGDVSLNVYVENYTDGDIEVERLSETEVRIIARQEAKKVVADDTPGIVSADLADPNGRVSRAIERNTSAQRKR